MKKSRLIALLAFGSLFCATWAQQTRILIYQVPLKVDNEVLLARELAFTMANQLESEFNLKPIVWTLLDPILRDAVTQGTVRADVDKAGVKEVRQAMSALQADFLAVVESSVKDQALQASLKLYRGTGSRPIYEKSLNMAATLGDNADADLARESTVRTWLIDLRREQFKDFLKTTAGGANDPSTGIALSPPTEPMTIRTPEEVLEVANKLVDAREPLDAAISLYEGIDQHPNNIDLRLRLIEVLQLIPRHDLAVIEAKQAVQMAPERIDLRILLARHYIEVRDLDAASAQLNECLARAPQDPAVLLLAGDSAMFKGRLDEAREQYLKAYSAKATPETAMALAITVAASGESAETLRLIDLAKSEDAAIQKALNTRFSIYGRLAVDSLSEAMRNVLLGVRVAVDRSPHLARAQRAHKGAECLTMLGVRLKPLAGSETLHKKRILAHKLLVQAAGAVLEYARTGNEDIASEAQIGLSDAVRRFNELPDGR